MEIQFNSNQIVLSKYLKILSFVLLWNNFTFSQQLLNNGFEEWIGDDITEQHAISWISSNEEISLNEMTGNMSVAFKSTDHTEGSYAIRLVSSPELFFDPSGQDPFIIQYSGGYIKQQIEGFNILPDSIVFYQKFLCDNSIDLPIINFNFSQYSTLEIPIANPMSSFFYFQPTDTSSTWARISLPIYNNMIPEMANGYYTMLMFADPSVLDMPGAQFYLDGIQFIYNDLNVTEKRNDNKLSIFPNPSNELLNIQVTENSACRISDIYGKEIDNIELIQNNLNTLDVSGYLNGVYFLKTESGISQTFSVFH